MKGFTYANLSKAQRTAIYWDLHKQCNGIEWIEIAFNHAWIAFEKGFFSYDGATFVKEHQNKFWEVASFIHDWLNLIGYVGKKIDLYFIKIMIQLNYPENIIFERCKWMQYTWINKLRHKIKGTFEADKVPTYLLKSNYIITN